ncbi:MAG: MATE family efflux transporter [Faecalibacterium sp.]
MQDRKEKTVASHSDSDFTQGSIPKKLAAFMMPILGALVLQAAYGAVDLLVVGRFGTTSGLSAVSTGSNVLNLATFVVTQLAMGTTVLIARYIGEKSSSDIGPLIGGSSVIFALISTVLFVVMVCFASPISQLMQAPEEAVELTSVYVRICGAGIFFIVAYNILAAIFRGLGDSRSPLIFVAVACVINVIGDLVLVAGLHMDAAGAALATVFAQAASVIFALFLLKKRAAGNDLPFRITRGDFRLNRQCRRALIIGLPLALQECLTQVSFLALCAFINRLGLEASSGYGVAGKIVSFAMLIPSALMQSMATFVSQNVGAGNGKRAKEAMATGIWIGSAIGCFVFAFVFLKGDLLTGIFTSDAAVIQNGFDYLKGFAPDAVLTAILFSMVGYFNGHGKTIWVMFQGLTQTLLVRLPLAYYMSIQPDASLTRIGFAAPASTIFGILLNVGFYIWTTVKDRQ